LTTKYRNRKLFHSRKPFSGVFRELVYVAGEAWWSFDSNAHECMNDVAGRLARKAQLTTDGLRVYLDTVDDAFGGNVNCAQLVNLID
jgi:hypothetical protein